MDTIKEVDEESNRDTIKGDLNTAAIQTKPPQIKETPNNYSKLCLDIYRIQWNQQEYFYTKHK